MAVKKYDHAVIYDGVFYPAFTEIPVKEETPKEKTVKKNDKGTGTKS